LYYVGQSTIRIAQQFKVDISTIAYWLRKEGVNRRSISERNRKYTLNHDYFEKIDSEQKAYFLGLLASDGCIADENKILLSLVITDGYLIESFKKAIGYTGPLFKMTRRNSSHKDMLRLSIRSSKMYNDLFNLGIVPRKSRVLQFPTSKEVPDLLIPHYIRGYLDGDGCVQLHHNLLSIGFVGTKEMMVGIQNNLVQHCAVNNTKLWETNVGSNNNNYTLRFGNQ
jgi:hypothetical protein